MLPQEKPTAIEQHIIGDELCAGQVGENMAALFEANACLPAVSLP
jgi:hypothetical protein